jgi:CubicO group peptidase (beta-lactamase class C family)
MKWSMRVLIAAAIAIASTASADPVDNYVRAQLQSRRLPGVSLAVVKNGRLVKAAGYGVASLELDSPATEKTVYEIGSISKQFTANAVLLLVEEGKVRLDDPLSMYLVKTPPAWSAITVRHILTHTAGLPDFDTGDIGFSYRREYTADEFVALLGRQPLDFPPGERWKYTNGFPLLGMVVERASGMPYTEFVRSRIFAPLGMESARFKTATDVVPHRADGYLLEDAAYRLGETLRPAVIAPNGGIMMNVVDFAKWDIAIAQGRLLRPESLKEMTTAVRLKDGRTVSHGLGWFMDSFNGHRFGAHWGTTVAGYSAAIRRYVDDGVSVIVLANLEDGGAGVDAMSKRIADLFVPGVDIHGLAPRTDPAPAETARLRDVLATIGAGREDERAPGLAARLPQPVRERIAGALRAAAPLEFLGDEPVGDRHFNLDPALASIRRYRVRTPDGPRYFTLRLSREGRLLGAIIED